MFIISKRNVQSWRNVFKSQFYYNNNSWKFIVSLLEFSAVSGVWYRTKIVWMQRLFTKDSGIFLSFFFKLRYSDIISMIYDLYSIRFTKLVRLGWKSWNLNIQSNRNSGHRAVTIAQKSYVGDYNLPILSKIFNLAGSSL